MSRLKSWIATAVLIAAALPLAILGATAEWKRASGPRLGARAEWLQDGEEARIRRALGADYRLYRAVADTPADAVVAIRVAVDEETFLTALHLETLLFPRRVEFLRGVVGLIAGREVYRKPFYVLDLEPESEFPWGDRFAPVERGHGFVLWRHLPEAE
ncbi:MAG: hypothetical protein V3T72_18095 [Thermoanaerobaculia bacterium]